MAFDAQTMFANLTEKERIKGHHSPEGRAIRTLSRALNGWSAGALSGRDVIVLCDQVIEDWLKARLTDSLWSAKSSGALVSQALAAGLITTEESTGLVDLHRWRVSGDTASAKVEHALEFCLVLIDKRW